MIDEIKNHVAITPDDTAIRGPFVLPIPIDTLRLTATAAWFGQKVGRVPRMRISQEIRASHPVGTAVLIGQQRLVGDGDGGGGDGGGVHGLFVSRFVPSRLHDLVPGHKLPLNSYVATKPPTMLDKCQGLFQDYTGGPTNLLASWFTLLAHRSSSRSKGKDACDPGVVQGLFQCLFFTPAHVCVCVSLTLAAFCRYALPFSSSSTRSMRW